MKYYILIFFIIVSSVFSQERYGRSFGVDISGTPERDAFYRLRVSEPLTVFESKPIYDNMTLIFDDAEVSGGSTASAYYPFRSVISLTVANETAGRRVRQSFRRMSYQPGKSQLFNHTGTIGVPTDGISKYVGMYDDNNGLFFMSANGTISVNVRSNVTGSPVTISVPQSKWNIDKVDGTGITKYSADWSKAQIFIIDYEWLGVGSVRFGIFIDGAPHYVHKISNFNESDGVYMGTPNLPIRFEIANNGDGPADSLIQICSSIISEGGQADIGSPVFVSTGSTHVDANVVDSIYAVVGIRLKAASIDASVKILSISMLSATPDDYQWLLYWQPTIAGTFTYSDVANSVIQYATGALANTISAGTVIAGGYVKSSNNAGQVEFNLDKVVAVGSMIDGTPTSVVLAVMPLSASLDIYGGIQILER